MTKTKINLQNLGGVRVDVAGAVAWLGRHLPVRERYLLTRNNRLRLRYIVPGAACALMMAGTMVSFSATSSALRTEDFSFIRQASLGPEGGVATDLDLMDRLQASHRRLQRYVSPEQTAAAEGEDADSGLTLASFQPPSLPKPKETVMEIGKGDTLAAVLHRAGVSAAEAYKAVEALKKEFDPRQIRPGQSVYVRMDPVSPEEQNDYHMTALDIAVDPFKSVALKRDGSDFNADVEEKTTERRVYAGRATVENSLYGSAAKAGLPNAVTAEVIRVMSWDIDFQRDVRRGDIMEVLYDQQETEDGKGVRFGNVLYARLNINGQDIPVYRHESKNGDVDYYGPDGQSVRKALMKTPVDGARVSSGYGMRKHPVLGYSKMHKGVDFAAPTGTPIYAAGDGTIEKMQRWSSYGNYVRIRHNGDIKTAYAHLSKFAKGLSAGSRVKQGQVIGYVGATGRVTGAHLHYEVLRGGTQVSPNSIKMQQGESLSGSELANFKARVTKINREYAELSGSDKFKVASVSELTN